MEKERKLKQLWRGAFNYRQSSRIEYAHAYTERQAWAIMCRRMAEKDGVAPASVMSLFDGKRDNYQIGLEMEIKEIAELEKREGK
jgi:hypothetical protein